MKKFFGLKFIGVPVVAIIATVLVVTTVLAFTPISNLWTSPTITVTAPPPPPPSNMALVVSSPDFNANRSILIGTPTLASVELSNPSLSGAPGYTGVNVLLTVDATGIVPSDVLLEYNDGTWHTLVLAQNGANSLSATFGPPGGFPIGFGYDVTTPLRATFNSAGVYHATAQAVN